MQRNDVICIEMTLESEIKLEPVTVLYRVGSNQNYLKKTVVDTVRLSLLSPNLKWGLLKYHNTVFICIIRAEQTEISTFITLSGCGYSNGTERNGEIVQNPPLFTGNHKFL